MSLKNIRINESLSLIEDYKPSLYLKLQTLNPDYTSIFAKGLKLGSDFDEDILLIKELIAQNNLVKAIELLKNYQILSEEITLSEAKLKNLDQNYSDNLINFESYFMHLGRITKSLLTSLKKVEGSNATDKKEHTSEHALFVNEQSEKNRLKIEIVTSSLEIVIEKCEILFPKLKARLRKNSNVQFYSLALNTLVSFLAIFSLLLKNQANNYLLISVFTIFFFCSILSLNSILKSNAFSFNSSNLFKTYGDLSDLHIKAESSLTNLKIYSSANVSYLKEDLLQFLGDGNELCAKIRKLINEI